MQHDYRSLTKADLADFSDFLHDLSDEQWDAPSLCEGWKVRDVVGHLTVGYTVPLRVIGAKVIRYRGNVNKGSDVLSRAYGREHTPAQILAAFDAGRTRPRGLGRIEKPHEALVDHLVHQQDCRRPLDMPRTIPADRAHALIDALPRAAGFVASKKRVAGLRLVATDIDHSVGDGPEVRGTAEALALAATGRVVSLDELEGDGLDLLVARVAPGRAQSGSSVPR
jgi:uncharacterized protein (TIGR03083 family)